MISGQLVREYSWMYKQTDRYIRDSDAILDIVKNICLKFNGDVCSIMKKAYGNIIKLLTDLTFFLA